MTPSEVDQELERLFVATRAATLPASGARERVRGAISARLAAPELGSTAPAPRAWLPWVIVGLVGLGAASFLAYRVSQAPVTMSPKASPLTVPVARPSAVPAERTAAVAAPSAGGETSPVAPHPDAEPSVVAKPAASSPVATSPSTARMAVGVEHGDELSLVRNMQSALRAGDTGRTLELASEHARRFPRGALVEEREGLRAVARCQVAPADARAAILAGFLESFGGSPYAARVKAVCR